MPAYDALQGAPVDPRDPRRRPNPPPWDRSGVPGPADPGPFDWAAWEAELEAAKQKAASFSLAQLEDDLAMQGITGSRQPAAPVGTPPPPVRVPDRRGGSIGPYEPTLWEKLKRYGERAIEIPGKVLSTASGAVMSPIVAGIEQLAGESSPYHEQINSMGEVTAPEPTGWGPRTLQHLKMVAEGRGADVRSFNPVTHFLPPEAQDPNATHQEQFQDTAYGVLRGLGGLAWDLGTDPIMVGATLAGVGAPSTVARVAGAGSTAARVGAATRALRAAGRGAGKAMHYAAPAFAVEGTRQALEVNENPEATTTERLLSAANMGMMAAPVAMQTARRIGRAAAPRPVKILDDPLGPRPTDFQRMSWDPSAVDRVSGEVGAQGRPPFAALQRMTDVKPPEPPAGTAGQPAVTPPAPSPPPASPAGAVQPGAAPMLDRGALEKGLWAAVKAGDQKGAQWFAEQLSKPAQAPGAPGQPPPEAPGAAPVPAQPSPQPPPSPLGGQVTPEQGLVFDAATQPRGAQEVQLPLPAVGDVPAAAGPVGKPVRVGTGQTVVPGRKLPPQNLAEVMRGPEFDYAENMVTPPGEMPPGVVPRVPDSEMPFRQTRWPAPPPEVELPPPGPIPGLGRVDLNEITTPRPDFEIKRRGVIPRPAGEPEVAGGPEAPVGEAKGGLPLRGVQTIQRPPQPPPDDFTLFRPQGPPSGPSQPPSRQGGLPGVLTGEVTPPPVREPGARPAAKGAAPAIATPAPPAPPGGRPTDPNIFLISHPEALGVSPTEYQFKASDKRGYTGALAGVTEWNPNSPPVLLHERADGSLWIADGHQRYLKYMDLMADGKVDPQQTPLRARIVREVEGWDVARVRRDASIRNIIEGSAGPIDIAKLLRSGGLTPKERGMVGGEIAGAKLRYAEGLTGLSDEAFQAVINGEVKPEYAASVARYFADPADHLAAVRALGQRQFSTIREAEAFVEAARNGLMVKREAGAQGRLWEDQELVDISAVQAKLVASVDSLLKSRRAAFGNILRNAPELKGAGNILVEDTNLGIKTDTQKLLAYFDRYRELSGSNTNRALTELSGDIYARRTSEADAANIILDAIRADIESGGATTRPAKASPDAVAGRPADSGRASELPVGQRAVPPVEPDLGPEVARQTMLDMANVVNRDAPPLADVPFDLQRPKAAEGAPPPKRAELEQLGQEDFSWMPEDMRGVRDTIQVVGDEGPQNNASGAKQGAGTSLEAENRFRTQKFGIADRGGNVTALVDATGVDVVPGKNQAKVIINPDGTYEFVGGNQQAFAAIRQPRGEGVRPQEPAPPADTQPIDLPTSLPARPGSLEDMLFRWERNQFGMKPTPEGKARYEAAAGKPIQRPDISKLPPVLGEIEGEQFTQRDLEQIIRDSVARGEDPPRRIMAMYLAEVKPENRTLTAGLPERGLSAIREITTELEQKGMGAERYAPTGELPMTEGQVAMRADHIANRRAPEPVVKPEPLPELSKILAPEETPAAAEGPRFDTETPEGKLAAAMVEHDKLRKAGKPTFGEERAKSAATIDQLEQDARMAFEENATPEELAWRNTLQRDMWPQREKGTLIPAITWEGQVYVGGDRMVGQTRARAPMHEAVLAAMLKDGIIEQKNVRALKHLFVDTKGDLWSYDREYKIPMKVVRDFNTQPPGAPPPAGAVQPKAKPPFRTAQRARAEADRIKAERTKPGDKRAEDMTDAELNEALAARAREEVPPAEMTDVEFADKLAADARNAEVGRIPEMSAEVERRTGFTKADQGEYIRTLRDAIDDTVLAEDAFLSDPVIHPGPETVTNQWMKQATGAEMWRRGLLPRRGPNKNIQGATPPRMTSLDELAERRKPPTAEDAWEREQYHDVSQVPEGEVVPERPQSLEGILSPKAKPGKNIAANIRSYLKKQEGYTDEQIDAMQPDEAAALGQRLGDAKRAAKKAQEEAAGGKPAGTFPPEETARTTPAAGKVDKAFAGKPPLRADVAEYGKALDKYFADPEHAVLDPADMPAFMEKQVQTVNRGIEIRKDIAARKAKVFPEATDAQLEELGRLQEEIEYLNSKYYPKAEQPPVGQGYEDAAVKGMTGRVSADKGFPEPAQGKIGLSPREQRRSAIERARLLANGDPISLDRYAKLLGELQDRKNAVIQRNNINARSMAPPKRADEYGGEYLGANLGNLYPEMRKLYNTDPAKFWRVMTGFRMITGGAVGANVDEEDPIRGAILGAIGGAVLDPRIFNSATREQMARRARAMTKLASISKPPQGEARLRNDRPAEKDIWYLQRFLPNRPEQTVPEAYKQASTLLDQYAEQVHYGDLAEMPASVQRVTGGLVARDVAAQLRAMSKEMKDKGLTNKAAYVMEMADAMAKKPTGMQMGFRKTFSGKEPLPYDAFESFAAKWTYRALTGYALDTPLQNLTQPILAMRHVDIPDILWGYKMARTPWGKSMTKHIDLHRPVDLEEALVAEKTPELTAEQKTWKGRLKRFAKDPQLLLAETDKFNRRVVYLAAMRQAAKRGLQGGFAGDWSMAVTDGTFRGAYRTQADRFARSVMRGTQGDVGPLAFNPQFRGPIGGSLRPFMKFPALLSGNLMDAMTQPDARGRARFFATVALAVALGKGLGLDLEDTLLMSGKPFGLDVTDPRNALQKIISGDVFPAVRGVKDIAKHVAGTAKHPKALPMMPTSVDQIPYAAEDFLNTDLAYLALGRFPVKAAQTAARFMRSDVLPAMSGEERTEHIIRTPSGSKSTVTAGEDALMLAGLRPSRPGKLGRELTDVNKLYMDDQGVRMRVRNELTRQAQIARDRRDFGQLAVIAQMMAVQLQSNKAPKEMLKGLDRTRFDKLLKQAPPDVREDIMRLHGKTINELTLR